jgi:hypothetical protein
MAASRLGAELLGGYHITAKDGVTPPKLTVTVSGNGAKGNVALNDLSPDGFTHLDETRSSIQGVRPPQRARIIVLPS